MHIVVALDEKNVEIQIRTSLQHVWAEVSEKWSDLDPGIKYGAGFRPVSDLLMDLSASHGRHEELSESLRLLSARVDQLPQDTQVDVQHMRERIESVSLELQNEKDKHLASLRALSELADEVDPTNDLLD